MSFLSSIAVNVVEDVAVGALTGGAGLAVEELAGQVMQSAMSEGLSQLGGQLGLDSGQTSDILSAAGFDPGASAVDTATSAGTQLGFSPSDQAGLGQHRARSEERDLSDAAARSAGGQPEFPSGTKVARQGRHGGMSVLEAIAFAMGGQMDEKLNDMASMAKQLGSTDTQSSQYGKLSSMIQAESQELSMLASAVNNSIKSIGDAGSTMAKKD